MFAVLPTIWKVLRISIPIPIALILAVGLWFTFDKHSAVRQAVDAQIDMFVSVVAREQLAEAERRRLVAVSAVKGLLVDRREDVGMATDFNQRIEDNENERPISPECGRVDDAFLDLLQ